MDIIATFYKQGGAWMHPILVMSIIGLGIMIERFIFCTSSTTSMRRVYGSDSELVMASSIDRAIKLCSAAPSAALPRVIKAGLMRANKGLRKSRTLLKKRRSRSCQSSPSAQPSFNRSLTRNAPRTSRYYPGSDRSVRCFKQHPCRSTTVDACRWYRYGDEYHRFRSDRRDSMPRRSIFLVQRDKEDHRRDRPILGTSRESPRIPPTRKRWRELGRHSVVSMRCRLGAAARQQFPW